MRWQRLILYSSFYNIIPGIIPTLFSYIYIIYLVNSVVSYLMFSYKRSLLIAYQRRDVADTIQAMLNVGKNHDTVRVVNDQIGTPTYTYDLARLLVDMNETEKYGYYHATNEGGYISWYDFTKEIYRQAGYKTEVLPVTTAEYGLSKAARPFNSRLDKSKLVEAGFAPLPTWQDALSRYLKEIEQ